MKKRKKGSTLITVLALSIVFMALGGVILAAIMGTMKSNTNQKIREDLKYAAESGLEIARSHLKGKSTITQVDIDEMNKKMNEVLVDISGDGVPDDNIGSVKLISPMISNGNLVNGKEKNDTSKINVKVRAEKNGDSNIYETISVNYNKIQGNFNNDIFNNGLVAGSGGIGINTSNEYGQEGVNLDTVISVNPGGSLNVNGEIKETVKKDYGNLKFSNKIDAKKEIIMRSKGGSTELNMQFPMMQNSKIFDFLYKEDGIEKEIIPTFLRVNLQKEIKIDEIDADGNSLGEIKIDNLKEKQMNSVIFMEIIGLNTHYPYVFILTNADELKIEMVGSVKMTRGALLNKGKISITGEGNFHMSYSTMFGSEIEIKANHNISVEGVGIISGHGMELNEDKLDKFLGELFENWGKNESSIGSGTFEMEGGFSD